MVLFSDFSFRAITRTGDLYVIEPYAADPATRYQYLGGVTEATAHQPTGDFVSIDTIPGRTAAVTESGELYEFRFNVPSGWLFLCSIELDLGVVDAEGRSMSDIKTMFR